MAANTADFWAAEIGVEAARTPVVILREQAAKLGPRTNNLLEARVRTTPIAYNDRLRHAFEIVVPALDHYAYELFALEHSVAAPYPVIFEEERGRVELLSEQELVRSLQGALSSRRTVELVNSLLTLVEG
jgi:hypothetical protein